MAIDPRRHRPYTITITLTNPLVALPSMLARQAQGLSIHPKSVIDAAGRIQLPPEALRMFPDHRAVLVYDENGVRITPP